MGRIAGFGTVTRVGAAGCLATGLALLGGGAGAAAAATAGSPLPTPLEQTTEGLSAVLGPQSLDAGGGPETPTEPDPLRPLDGATGRLDSLLPGDQHPAGGEDPVAEEPPAEGGHEDGEGGDDDGGDDVGETAPAEGAAPPREEPAAAVDAEVDGLVGACVRVPREVAPLQATVVVLDHDVIATLTDAGLPLEQLVVPCPAGEGPLSPDDPGTPTVPGDSGGAAPGDRPASAVPALPDRLAYTGAETLPLASFAVALLSLGALMTRRARRLRPCASRG